MGRKRIRKMLTLDPAAIEVLEVLSQESAVSQSQIVEMYLISRGVEAGLITTDRTQEIGKERNDVYVRTDKLNSYKEQISNANRRIEELKQQLKKESQTLEAFLYQIRDMLNSELNYSVPKDETFASGDPVCEDSLPHPFLVKSIENFQAQKREINLMAKTVRNMGGKS